MADMTVGQAPYAERDIMALDREGGYYARHVFAMTKHRLHDKSDIAAELAWRDQQITTLRAEIERLEAAEGVVEAFRALADKKLHQSEIAGSTPYARGAKSAIEVVWGEITEILTTYDQEKAREHD